ncbi:energy transducer TonB [Dyella acidisoli]|uniref:Cell envelope biogenesis protein TonB n=1 Tax=Dyella acidisoli TaxID=1867834 RepID=A0ABQ5XLT4_9GAMM|nr:energy transducer TonB [Dyella acidisoli]GLQ92523.1 cell envelope biogenesis protein TonB [Dyella acidisoli]
MSSAGLAVVRRAHHPDMDMMRVAALSAAITLNLAALIFAMRPLAPQIAEVIESVKPTTIHIFRDPPPPPPPPDIVLKPLPKSMPVTAPVHVMQKVSPPTPTAPPTIEPSDNPRPAPPPVNVTPPPSIAPGVVSLAYRASPLHFPVQAVRMHMQGTVLLRVLVDENGKPIDVVVEHSSGYSALDKSAREQVLSSWLFQPAVIDGHAVKAWAQVPVDFVLRDM